MTRPPFHHRVFGTSFEASWFVNNGPHGPHFTWDRDRTGHCGIEHLRRVVAEQAEHNPVFGEAVRSVALKALLIGEVNLMRRAIQVLCVVGSDDDIASLRQLAQHPSANLRKDLRACLFERGFKAACP